jgi:hypothetical protein
MNDQSTAGRRFADLASGDRFPPLAVTVTEPANRRYFEAAGVRHPALEAGALYPPIAANLSIMLFQQGCGDAVLHTRHRLTCHGSAAAGTPLVVEGRVIGRDERRGRAYVEVETVVRADGRPLWTSVATFTPVAG